MKTVLPFLVGLLSTSAFASAQYEEIIVTAQKRQQQLNEVPIAISVFNADLLEQVGFRTLSDITSSMPNVSVALPNGDILPIFSIRGISMADYSVNQSSPISIYLDEQYLGANYTHGISLFDLERIEVLKGPQGTLYGKNTTGGAINLISKSPDFTRKGYVQLTAGNYHSRGIDAAYQAPLIKDTLSARLAFVADKANGYTKNHFPGGKDLSGVDHHAARLTFNFQASESLNAQLKLNIGRSSPETQAVIPEATNPGGVNHLGYRRPDHYDNFETDANKVDKMKIKTDGGLLTLKWEGRSLLLTSITGIYHSEYDLRADSDGSPQQLLEIDYFSEMDQWSQSFRLSNLADGPLAYTAGLYLGAEDIKTDVAYDYYHELQPLVPGFVFPAEGIVSGFTQVQRYQQKRETQAVYGELSYVFNDQLTLTTGIRYTRDKNKQFNLHTFISDYAGSPQAGLLPFTMPYDPDAIYPRRSFSDNEWSGTIKLSYHLDDDTMMYSSYSRGNRSGAFNGAAISSPSEITPVDPEHVNAYELGIKGTLADGRLRYSSALFYYDYRNQQFLNVVGTQQLLDSAKRARISGFEAELNTQLGKNFNLQLGFGLLDSEYTDGPHLNAQEQQWNLQGNELLNAPEITANIAARHQINISGGKLTSSFELNYNGEQWFTAFNDKAGYDNISQAGYSVSNARMRFEPTDSNIELSLWVKNLTDKDYKVYAINLSEGFGYHYTLRGAPRTYGADLRFTF